MGCSHSRYTDDPDIQRYRKDLNEIGLYNDEIDQLDKLYLKLVYNANLFDGGMRTSTILEYLHVNYNNFVIKLLSIFNAGKSNTITNFKQFCFAVWNFGTLSEQSLGNADLDKEHMIIMINDLMDRNDASLSKILAIIERVPAHFTWNKESFFTFIDTYPFIFNKFKQIQIKFQTNIFNISIWNQFKQFRSNKKEPKIAKIFQKTQPEIFDGVQNLIKLKTYRTFSMNSNVSSSRMLSKRSLKSDRSYNRRVTFCEEISFKDAAVHSFINEEEAITTITPEQQQLEIDEQTTQQHHQQSQQYYHNPLKSIITRISDSNKDIHNNNHWNHVNNNHCNHVNHNMGSISFSSLNHSNKNTKANHTHMISKNKMDSNATTTTTTIPRPSISSTLAPITPALTTITSPLPSSSSSSFIYSPSSIFLRMNSSDMLIPSSLSSSSSDITPSSSSLLSQPQLRKSSPSLGIGFNGKSIDTDNDTEINIDKGIITDETAQRSPLRQLLKADFNRRIHSKDYSSYYSSIIRKRYNSTVIVIPAATGTTIESTDQIININTDHNEANTTNTTITAINTSNHICLESIKESENIDYNAYQTNDNSGYNSDVNYDENKICIDGSSKGSDGQDILQSLRNSLISFTTINNRKTSIPAYINSNFINTSTSTSNNTNHTSNEEVDNEVEVGVELDDEDCINEKDVNDDDGSCNSVTSNGNINEFKLIDQKEYRQMLKATLEVQRQEVRQDLHSANRILGKE
eukprot:gene2621-5127_t